MSGHGSHNGLCTACLDDGVLHIVVACNGSQGAEHLFHKVLCGGQGEIILAYVPAVSLLLSEWWEGILKKISLSVCVGTHVAIPG